MVGVGQMRRRAATTIQRYERGKQGRSRAKSGKNLRYERWLGKSGVPAGSRLIGEGEKETLNLSIVTDVGLQLAVEPTATSDAVVAGNMVPAVRSALGICGWLGR